MSTQFSASTLLFSDPGGRFVWKILFSPRLQLLHWEQPWFAQLVCSPLERNNRGYYKAVDTRP
jgi:hypothetical protein